MTIPAAALLALLLQTPDSVAARIEPVQPEDSIPLPTDSYADAGAADLMQRTRAYAEATKSDIEAYRLLSRYTLSIGLSTGKRDRLLYKRELGWRVSWRRDEEWRVDILGSRETLPLFLPAPRSGDSNEELGLLDPDFIIGNRGQWLLQLPASGSKSNSSLNHPLAQGSERHYFFATGDTTRIQIPGQDPIMLVELKITPRRARAELLIGSWWLDGETGAPVRAAFRLATPARMIIDSSTRRILPGLGDNLEIASLDLDYLTLEYALWENRWWLPRLLSMQGRARAAGVEIPVLIEQTYEELELFAASDAWTPLPPPDTTLFREVEEDADGEKDAVQDSTQKRRIYTLRTDSLLVSSPYLADSPYGIGSSLSDAELDRIRAAIDVDLPPVALGRPEVSWTAFAPGLLRYNRVEGLAVGTRAGIRHGSLSLDALGRLGLAGPTPSGSVALKDTSPDGQRFLSLYSDISAFTPADRPLALGNSASALFFGNDDGDYYRRSGVSAGIDGRFSRFNWSEVGLLLYAERQGPLAANTDWSVAEWSRGAIFRPNPAADRATQIGAETSLAFRTGLQANSFRAGSSIRISGETGTFDFARIGLDGYAGFPLPGPLVGGFEVGAGRIFGTAPLQKLWYVGGPSTVRGFDPADRVSGTTFWRGRAELATDKPRLRGVLFIDSGFAGDTFRGGDLQLISAGFGVSAMDGLLRADIARTVRGGSGWGLQLYLDAPL